MIYTDSILLDLAIIVTMFLVVWFFSSVIALTIIWLMGYPIT